MSKFVDSPCGKEMSAKAKRLPQAVVQQFHVKFSNRAIQLQF